MAGRWKTEGKVDFGCYCFCFLCVELISFPPLGFLFFTVLFIHLFTLIPPLSFILS